MSISLIVLIYNHAKFLPDLFHSIKLNENELEEIFFIDNSSSDQSFSIVEHFAAEYKGKVRINSTRYEEPLKVTVALNRALRQVSTKYVAFISGDDFFLAKRFVNQLQALEDNQDVAFVYSNGVYCDEDGNLTNKAIIADKIKNIFANKLNANKDHLYYLAPALYGQCALYRITTLQSIGWFDEALLIDDWPLHILLFSKYPTQNMFLDDFVIAYRQHTINAHKIPFRQYMGQKEVLSKYSTGLPLRKGLYILYMRQALYFLKKRQMYRFKIFFFSAIKQSSGIYFSTLFLLNEFKSKFKAL